MFYSRRLRQSHRYSAFQGRALERAAGKKCQPRSQRRLSPSYLQSLPPQGQTSFVLPRDDHRETSTPVESVSSWCAVKSNSEKTYLSRVKKSPAETAPFNAKCKNGFTELRQRFDASVCHDASQQFQPLSGFRCKSMITPPPSFFVLQF